jgi:CIC family chloride channel protein
MLHRLTATSLAGLIVGLITAFATVGFVEMVQYLNDLLFISASSRASLSGMQLSLITIATLTIGGLIVGLIMQFGVSQKPSLGPPDTIFAVQLHERLPTPMAGLSSTLASILSLGCGASVGQYGPLVYLGTLVGQLSNRLPLGLPYMRSMTIACGVAAAISTAFNAPIAALIYFVANVVFDYTPIFLIETDGSFRAIEFLLFTIEGIACGILAVLLMKSLQYSAKLSQRVKIPFALKPMIAGFVVSLIALQVPEVLGAGQDVFHEVILGNSYSAEALLLILITKLLVTLICIGFGFAGGVIFSARCMLYWCPSCYSTVIPVSSTTPSAAWSR